MSATRAHIYLGHLASNISAIRDTIGKHPLICLAVKADAYGHGARQIAECALSAGADWLAVAFASEGVELRTTLPNVPILNLGVPLYQEIEALISYDIRSVVADRGLIETFSKEAKRLGRRARVHLAVDTGMGRNGCRLDEAVDLATQIAGDHDLELEGVCTHFAAAESDQDFTEGQILSFEDAIARIRANGVEPGLVHAANSGAMIAYPHTRYDMVRPGIIAYGYYPSEEMRSAISVTPVMELISKVVYLKRVPPDTPISYGHTYTTSRETVIATVAAGYGDGYNRRLSGSGVVSVRDKRYPVVGRVCMDQFMIDAGPEPLIELHDDVVLFGPNVPAPDAEDIAALCGTIPYEITCSIAVRVPRIFID